ncbi:hypothetical protein D917_06624 [Trichinella nativa]|uniref:Uncharacterized protein n=1 Tax=Trichinella nativa TaxID=6335 RepID=A0A1Y3EVI2_9BILA|nr:hypothetical protein D917_06624 [Trichinella nativa]
MDPMNRFILKLQRNPAFFEAFLRSLTESRFTNASTVDQSQKLSQQVLADDKRMLSQLKEKTRELKQILTKDMFYSLQAAVNTYDIFHFCNWYGNSTRGFSQKDIQNVYDARRIVNAVVAIRMEKITSVKGKKAGHVHTLSGYRMDSLNCDNVVLEIFGHLKMIDYRLACLENKIAEKASQANLSAEGWDDIEELVESNQNMKSRKLSDDMLKQKAQELVAFCDHLAEEFLENEK